MKNSLQGISLFRSTPISAFDLDYTLIRANTSFLFFRYLVRKKKLVFTELLQAGKALLEYRFGKLDLYGFHANVFTNLLKGKLALEMEYAVEIFLREDFYRFFYLPSFSRLRRAQHQGEHAFILSSSPSFIVGPIARYLGVSKWYSSEYQVDQEGRFTQIAKVLCGKEKARYLIRLSKDYGTKRSDVTAYSDSLLDLPFLSSAGKAVVVRPHKSLYAISQKNNWEVI